MKDLFFVCCPENGFDCFLTLDAALDEANERIQGYLGDGWSEEVTGVCVGEITHRAKMCDQVFPDGEIDEDGIDEAGEYWDSDWDYKCNYKMLPVEQNPAPDVSHIVKLLDRARSSVDYQMSAQNQNHEAGRKHYAHFQSLLGEIDAAIAAYRKQGGDL